MYPFANTKDANTYLSNSIVWYGETPVFVTKVDDDWLLHFHVLKNLEESIGMGYEPSVVALNSDITWQNLKLGYVNYNSRAVYTGRIPDRQWKFGVSVSNMFNSSGFDNFKLISGGMEDTLLNNYPPLSAAIRLAKENVVSSLAFSRRFAVKHSPLGQLLIEYKGSDIAYETGNGFKLGLGFEFMKEHLESVGVTVDG